MLVCSQAIVPCLNRGLPRRCARHRSLGPNRVLLRKCAPRRSRVRNRVPRLHLVSNRGPNPNPTSRATNSRMI